MLRRISILWAWQHIDRPKSPVDVYLSSCMGAPIMIKMPAGCKLVTSVRSNSEPDSSILVVLTAGHCGIQTAS